MPKSIKRSSKIYLDYAAGVPVNPSSIHDMGLSARKKLEASRKEVALILGCSSHEVIFTSGGTESNNLAIQGAVLGAKEELGGIPHVITTNIEHPSVLETCRLLEKRKLAEVSIVPVEEDGIVDPKKIKKEIKENTVLVSVMYANNEIGTIQPIKEIAKEIRHLKKTRDKSLAPSAYPIFHTDAVQAANYLDLNAEKLGVDLLSLSGTKIKDSGRAGVLYKKKNAKLANLFGGGDQEGGLRPGTESLEEIIKFSKAFQKAVSKKDQELKRLTVLRNYFFAKLKNFAPLVNGDQEKRLPNNVNITFPKIPSDLLVVELSSRGIMASSKSACKEGSTDGSYVIAALRSKSIEVGGLRFSFGESTTKKEIDYTIKSLKEILQKLEKWYH